MKNKKSSENFLDFLPERNIQWETDEKGIIILLKEKSRIKLIKKLVSVFNRDQFMKIHLDKTGSDVWKRIDGRKNILEICKEIRFENNSDIPRLEERVSYFLRLMEKNNFVVIKKKPAI